jgi:hypothetical protein
MFVSESVISIVMIMSIMACRHSVQVTCVICVIIRNEMCGGVCRVGLVLSVVLLRHGWNTTTKSQ